MKGAGERIGGLLRDRGIDWPATLEHFETLPSTNEWLKERAREGAPEWTVAVADLQTAGRGRHGRAWLAQEGDLVLSVLVRPRASPDALLLLPLAAGVAVAEAAAELGAAVSLKWPNDVVVERGHGDGADYGKLAGILVEGVSEAERMAAVIGVGLNIVDRDDPDVRAQATSLRAACGRAVDRDVAGAAVLARMRVWYDVVARGDAGAVVEAFTARGIDSRGALLLELDDGTTAAVVSGEARQVRLR